MDAETFVKIDKYIRKNIARFHNNRLDRIQRLKLTDILKRKNPYLFKATQHIQPVLGICYGKFKTVNNGEYLKIGGQSFWHFISGSSSLYVDLIEPLGHEARLHNEKYLIEKDNTYNRFAREFTNMFCDDTGQIKWAELVKFNSGNLLDRS